MKPLRVGLLSCLLISAVLLGMGALAPPAYAQASAVTLTWTATGDDSTSGTVNGYLYEYSPTTPDTTGVTAWLDSGGILSKAPAGVVAWRTTAKTAPGPVPLPAGSPSSGIITDSFLAGQKWWFILRACDEAQNCVRSNFSALVIPTVDVTVPKAIRDLRARL